MPYDCIECQSGNLHVAIPADEIERIAEFDCAPPPPLAHDWIGGIGLHGGDIFVLISLGRETAAPRQRHAVIIKQRGEAFRWALEVEKVKGLISLDAARTELTSAGVRFPKTWLTASGTRNAGAMAPDESLHVLNVFAVRKSLEDGPESVGTGINS